MNTLSVWLVMIRVVVSVVNHSHQSCAGCVGVGCSVELAVVNLAHAGARFSSHSVCLCVCVYYRSSGCYAYSTGPTKVPKESTRHKGQNQRRNRAKTSLFESCDSL